MFSVLVSPRFVIFFALLTFYPRQSPTTTYTHTHTHTPVSISAPTIISFATEVYALGHCGGYLMAAPI